MSSSVFGETHQGLSNNLFGDGSFWSPCQSTEDISSPAYIKISVLMTTTTFMRMTHWWWFILASLIHTRIIRIFHILRKKGLVLSRLIEGKAVQSLVVFFVVANFLKKNICNFEGAGDKNEQINHFVCTFPQVCSMVNFFGWKYR